ncbi:unnamed protein product [Paramecium primaurelia]|uniref:Uncharacterized protein n=2 Tax=Paramecium TaxID=5884 RepID=A0A8S1W6D7_9CILI|nr:unnamed protein product [Paramecium primaurelia]CAD8184961.1 unnamed protein product [Paramecium pentaurelia]
MSQQEEIQQQAQIKPSPDCIEYKLNFYHLHGIQSCPYCNKPETQQIPKELTNEDIEKYQNEVLQKQKDLLIDIDPEDPDQMMDLFEKYKDCPCCKGLVLNCEGVICEQLGLCYCIQKDLQDRQS